MVAATPLKNKTYTDYLALPEGTKDVAEEEMVMD